MKTFFITGTDTNCGKTYVTCQLLDYLNEQQKKGLALKPVASGCFLSNGQLLNDDVLSLQKHNRNQDYSINGWQFPEPISPHLAAKAAGSSLTAHEIADFCLSRQFANHDYLLVEGAGGLLVPLNDKETWLDFLNLTQMPVILVVGMRLGCLNHALLTASVLKNNRTACVGWVANCLDKEMLALTENIATLSLKMEIPLLATIPYQGKLTETIKLSQLFG
ncbi:dethiobiotin synthase [Legionella sp. 29fVS95]|uniref:dethiobiotin synthase n=1 Tax=Legionella sp. 29fVS95 TaxID=3402813 RepID=UPI003AF4630C